MEIRTSNKHEVCKTVGKNTLRFIREVGGIDFEQATIINRFYGNFTIKKIFDSLPDYDYTVFIIARKGKENFDCRFYAVELFENGNFSVELKSSTYFDSHSIPETYWRKGDFDTLRKSTKADGFIIAQRKDYNVNRLLRDSYHSIGRYAIQEGCRYLLSEDNRNSSRNMYLKDIQKTGQPFYYTVPCGCKYLDLFDKSGYFVKNIRTNLIQRAKALRAEREREKVKNIDLTGRVLELNSKATEINNFIAKRITNSFDHDSLYKLHQSCYDLSWVWFDIARYQDGVKNKTFSSIESAERLYNSIIEKINKIRNVEEV